MIKKSDCTEVFPIEYLEWIDRREIMRPWLDKRRVCPRWFTYYRNRKHSLARVIYQKHHGIDLDDGQQINHSCGNSMCLNINHLYSGNHRQNMRDKIRHGTSNLGKKWKVKPENIHYFKLDQEKYKEIRSLYATGEVSQRKLASHFGVSQCLINKIIKTAPMAKTFSELLLNA